MHITGQSLIGMTDHSLLKPDATLADLAVFARVCRAYGFKAACINSCHTQLMVELLAGSDVLAAPTIGFPLGAASTSAKASEAGWARDAGAGEMDMVINIGLLRSGEASSVGDDVSAVVAAASGVPVKVIIEACYLTDDQKQEACHLAVQAGAAFVKTSTGFGEGGATPHDVALMCRAVSGTGVQVKAAGGIRDVSTAIAMIAAGATRIGVSAGDAIADQFAATYPAGCEVRTAN